MMKRYIKVALPAVCAVLMLTTFAAAQPHPAYLKALSNLRYARALLENTNPNAPWAPPVAKAIGGIDMAIKQIKIASVEDGKNLNDHPPIDSKVLYGDRLRSANSLLEEAYREISQRESDDFAQGLKHRALDFIRGSQGFINRAIELQGR
jgi:hypothetical protein